MKSLSPTKLARVLLLLTGLTLLVGGAANHTTALAQQQQEAPPRSSESAATTAATTPQQTTGQSSPDDAPAPPAAGNSAAAQTESAAADELPFMRDDRGQSAAAERQAGGETPSSFNLLARTIGALLLIVGLIFGAGWALRKFGGDRFNARPDGERGPTLAVLSSLTIGDRRTLTVVKFGGRTLLVGSTPHSVALLAEEDAPAQSAPIRSVAEMLDGDGGPDSFPDELVDAERRFEATAAAAAPLTTIWNEQRRRRSVGGDAAL